MSGHFPDLPWSTLGSAEATKRAMERQEETMRALESLQLNSPEPGYRLMADWVDALIPTTKVGK